MIIEKDEKGNIQIDLLALCEYLLHNFLLIVLVSLVCATLLFGYTYFFVSPLYQAKASMYVNNSSFSLGASNFSISSSELSAGSSLVDVYSYILKSRTTIEEVIKKTGVDYSYEEMLNNIISVEKVSNTAGFEVIATSTSAAETELIANAFAEILPGRIAEIVDGASVRIVDYAIIPSHRSSPSYVKNALIGALVGVVAACIGLTLYEMKKESANVVVDSADTLKKKYPDIPILALIPDMRYSDKKGYYSYGYGYGRYDSEHSS